MSDFVCSKCGRDCKSKMALDKHQPTCGLMSEHDHYTNRFDDTDRCPKCSQWGKSFFKKDAFTYACLECGTHFVPRDVLSKLKDEAAKIAWKRP